MNNLKLYPKISAQVFDSAQKKDEIYFFNSNTNRGFSLDGYAALLCRNFNGEKSLEVVISEFEKEHHLEKGEFNAEIEKLLKQLEEHRIVTFHNSPKNDLP